MNTTVAASYLTAACEALNSRKEEINRLNVFPVPDGDTGTNMSLTMEMVVKEVSSLPIGASAQDLYKAISHGSLMGARGNSGVITSQILRGICEGAQKCDAFGPESIAICLENAVEVAFQAVRKPVEGTILTVISDCAKAARAAVGDGLDLVGCLKAIAQEAFESVKRTPELLAVLKENNVVDAGGFGLAVLIDGFVAAVLGESSFMPDAASVSRPEPKVAIEQVNDWAGSKFLYCTEFLFHGEGLDEPATSEFLSSMGDCELLVGSCPDYKIHVHTNTPGTVISYMTERGQVSEVHIHNMKLQAQDRASALEEEVKDIGFVAVAAGSGMEAILKSLGVDVVVSGGQTMNPSTADLLKAVKDAHAKQVIILPNNSNIQLAAASAASEAEIPCAVVPTRTVPEAFCAMFVADAQATLEENVQAMTQALEGVVCAEVTTAVRCAKAADGSEIAQGDVIGITGGKITRVGSSVCEVALQLVGDLAAVGDFDTLTLLAGEDMDDSALAELVARIEAAHPDIEVEPHRGEQPLYPVVFSLE